jgi:hypothetical protein
MTATATQIEQLRRMVNEPTQTPYSDAALAGYVEAHPLVDELGYEPYYFDMTIPPVKKINPDWTPTYDLNAAAADIWSEKAAMLANNVDFNADGQNISYSQTFEHAKKMARYFASKSSVKVIVQNPTGKLPQREVSERPWLE